MNKYGERFKGSEIEPAIIWLNRSLRFYLPTRELCYRDYRTYNSAIMFLGYQTVESALKASLVLWDKSFDPIKYGHNTKKMFRIYQNKVPEDLRFVDQLHPYFEDFRRYQELPRYPNKHMAFLPVDPSYLEKLDYAFCGFACARPRSNWKTEFEHVLSGQDPSKLKVFEKGNCQIGAVRRRLGIKIGHNPRPGPVE